MNIIELERWKPSEADPRKLEYAGQPIAQEVFEELKHRLESQGYLPDEYFLMDSEWENGRKIPKDADIFCTTDYGGSEGVYLDVYLKWYEDGKPIYNLIRYGSTGGVGGVGIGGTDPPFVGADGFCSPVGASWREKVTSEFGYRKDPFTGKTKGHSGMDIAVPTGTSVRAALPGTVTVSKYNAGGYGYYVMIDHGGGLVTLYGHCSKLLATVGQTVLAGDVIALSGSTGRSTGPHLHFEVRVNGERTNPRPYLP